MLNNKKILIIGIRNKWSIAFGIAEEAYKQGAELIFVYKGKDNEDKIKELIEPFANSKYYDISDISCEDEMRRVIQKIKKYNGKVDGIVHAVAHAYTDDLHNDFINTSKEGFIHALDVSSYSFVMLSRLALEYDFLNDNASLVTLSYYGSIKVLPGYNVMGVAKAALESEVRYLAENLGKQGIRVNAISAGPIKTLSAKGIKDFNSMLEIAEKKNPMQKNVTQRQVGSAVAFMLSEMSSGITGQTIYVDNGYSIMGI